MPTGRSGAAGAVVGDCLYVFGGEGNASDPNGIFHQVEAYEASTDTWRQLPPMQTTQHRIYAAVLGNVAYLPGGATMPGNRGDGGQRGLRGRRAAVSSPRQKVVLAPRRTMLPRSP